MNPIKKWLRKREIRKGLESRLKLYEDKLEFYEVTLADIGRFKDEKTFYKSRIEQLKRELNELD